MAIAKIIVDVPLMQTDQPYSYKIPEEFKDIDLTKVHEEFQETLFNSELTGIYAYPEVN